jgi:hypothetical protein
MRGMKPRFTIRDLFWLTMVVPICLAWRFWNPETPGRYQFIPRTAVPGFANTPDKIMDTSTGRVWVDGGATWIEDQHKSLPGH